MRPNHKGPRLIQDLKTSRIRKLPPSRTSPIRYQLFLDFKDAGIAVVYPKCRTHPCPPNEKHPPDSRTGDPELLGAKCRITPKFPNESAPIGYRNRAPKAHTRKFPSFHLRARPLCLRWILISRHTPGGLLRRTSPS